MAEKDETTGVPGIGVPPQRGLGEPGPRHAARPAIPQQRGPYPPAARPWSGHGPATAAHAFAGGQAGPPPGYGVPGYGPAPYTPPLPTGSVRRTPRWLLPAALCAVIVLAGAALGGITVAAVSAGQGTESPVVAGTGDRAFLAALARQPSFADIPPDTLIDLGHTVCAALEEGASRGELVSATVSAGFGPRDARLLVDAANASYCPGA